jgi:hypothetical protein
MRDHSKIAPLSSLRFALTGMRLLRGKRDHPPGLTRLRVLPLFWAGALPEVSSYGGAIEKGRFADRYELPGTLLNSMRSLPFTVTT